MKLSALLVDDETPILQNLQAVLPWEALGMTVAGCARNGMEALEKAQVLRPDLILCDIRMPVMDGLSFLAELRAFDRDTEVIMLTGYAEFEYARSAIHHRVRDYVLKPIDYDALTALLERTAESIRARRSARRSEQQRIGRAMDLAHEKLLQDLLLGVTDGEDLQAGLPGVGGEDGGQPLTCAVMLADADVYAQRGHAAADRERERKLWNFAVRNVLREAISLADGQRLAVLQMREGEWCVIAEWAEGAEEVSIADWAGALQQTVLDVLNIRLSVCYSPVPVAAGALSATYRNLQRSVQFAPPGEHGVWPLAEAGEQESDRDAVWETIDELAAAIKQCDRPAADRLLDVLASRFQGAGRSLDLMHKIAHFSVLHLLRDMRALQVLSAETEKALWEQLEQSDRLQETLAILRRITEASLEAQSGQKTADRLMVAAKDYVDRHLSRDLGVDEVAGHLGISASYFSLLFKRHFGVTFVEYITTERIELAKSMLLLTDRSVTEIGRAVGFAERRYFSKVFQKRTGDLPSTFRTKARAGHDERGRPRHANTGELDAQGQNRTGGHGRF